MSQLQRVRSFLVAGMAASALVAIALPSAAAFLPSPIVPAACRIGGSGCTLCHLGELVINLTQYLIYGVALPGTVLLVAIGGLMLLISGASEKRRTLGKEILTSTLIGAIIVLVAWLGVDTLIKVLTLKNAGGPPGKFLEQLGPWNEFEVTNCPL